MGSACGSAVSSLNGYGQALQQAQMENIRLLQLAAMQQQPSDHSFNGFIHRFNQNASASAVSSTPPEEVYKGGFMQSLKTYIDKHRDAIFTIALVFLADHYLFQGAFRERIQTMLEGLLNKAHKKLDSGLDS